MLPRPVNGGEEAPHGAGRSRREPSASRAKALLRWGAAIALLAVSVRLLLRDPEPIRRLLALRWEIAAVLALLAVLNNLFMSWRLSLAVTECGGPRVPPAAWFRLVVLGQFLNLVFPQLGNVYRGVLLKREHGVSYMAYASGLFAFVWLDTLLGFTLCLAVLSLLRPGLTLAGVPAVPVILLVLVLLVGTPIAVARLLGSFRIRRGWLGRAQERATQLLETMTRSLARPRFVARFFMVNLLVALEQMLALWLCFHAVGHPIDLPTAALFQVLVKLSNQVVVTPGNLGLTELAWGGLGALAQGGGVGHGIAAALLFRASFTVVLLVLGVLFGGVGLLRSRQHYASEAREEPASPQPGERAT